MRVSFDTPILFLIFNRPDTTELVFARIRDIKPSQLFIAADGPRKGKAGESGLCNQVREQVLSAVDWECKVMTLFREENLGCGKAVSEAISWFFENVEEGIIVEDDVLPTESFFHFCREMLQRFQKDNRIMHIGGNNFQFSRIGSDCYYLSKLPHIWGWATWKRAWNFYDYSLTKFDQKKIANYFDCIEIDTYWHSLFSASKDGTSQSNWDCQWVFAILSHNGLSVLPQKNLVSNIGFGTQSTHTSDESNVFANLKSYDMEIVRGDDIVKYDPSPDLNFHRLLRWEVNVNPLKTASLTTGLNIIFSRLKAKLFSTNSITN